MPALINHWREDPLHARYLFIGQQLPLEKTIRDWIEKRVRASEKRQMQEDKIAYEKFMKLSDQDKKKAMKKKWTKKALRYAVLHPGKTANAAIKAFQTYKDYQRHGFATRGYKQVRQNTEKDAEEEYLKTLHRMYEHEPQKLQKALILISLEHVILLKRVKNIMLN